MSAEEQYHQQDDLKFYVLQKHYSLSAAKYRTFLFLLHELLLLSQNQGYDGGFLRLLQNGLSLALSVVS